VWGGGWGMKRMPNAFLRRDGRDDARLEMIEWTNFGNLRAGGRRLQLAQQENDGFNGAR
jgi:hypothetical protein